MNIIYILDRGCKVTLIKSINTNITKSNILLCQFEKQAVSYYFVLSFFPFKKQSKIVVLVTKMELKINKR